MAPNDRSPVTVIGLGLMGSALARTLVGHGHPTTVWNRTAEKADELVALGATLAATPRDAVLASPTVIVCVTDYPAAYEVLESCGDALSGRRLVNLSTGTPEQAHEASAWASERGAHYLDGAVMATPSGVGGSEAVLFYSGAEEVFAAEREMLNRLGGATSYLGADYGLASVYDSSLLGVEWGLLSGYFHAFSLVGTEGAKASAFLPVAMQFLRSIEAVFHEVARQVDEGKYPSDEETLDIHLNAMEHLIETSRARGIGVTVPEFYKSIIARAVALGHGDDGLPSAFEAVKRPG
ncbi:3-hydroxyisobutyrate dehydrogenase [Microtetraspora sp. NBRC 13810]|uniref:NAD(P)-dependent oxidoreductase n=1 Tax=Microtetraspora sp. NBRC 13810 TaxID=3030990 RepID=UPI00249FCC14|nr:NAD(P)-binding domain-containing protein [Microtetraspora sp. NBRC 13810]GLW09912.1 3-hydroxyisobutyrate dehydrogenase [Microtetraspora sp. NBRC 13810]